jgi:hypothetical protein
MEDLFFIGAQKVRCLDIKKSIQRLHGLDQHFAERVFLTLRQSERIFAQTLFETAHVLVTKATSRSQLATHVNTGLLQFSAVQVRC